MIKSILTGLGSTPIGPNRKNLMFSLGKTQLYAQYDPVHHQVQYDVIMEPNSYLALGYGKEFANTDVIYWGANGIQGLQEDMYAFSHDEIKHDANNSYVTTYSVMENNMIHFTTIRDIESSPDNFVIPLDRKIPMVGSYSDSTHEMAQVEASKFAWTMTLNSDGSSISHRQLGLPGHPDWSEHGDAWMNVHGIVMWTAWGICNMLQFIT
jgi:hypothetical protein